MKTPPQKSPSPPTDPTPPFPIIADEISLRVLDPPAGVLARAWNWIGSWRSARSTSRRLRVAETVSLGEKRFVAVVQVDGRHFLLAGGPTNIALLAQLDDKEPFEDVLKKTMTPLAKRPGKSKQPAKHSARQGPVRIAKPVKKQNPAVAGPTEHYA